MSPQDILTLLTSALSILGPIGLTLVFCLGAGYLIRLTPIKNKWIPFIQPLIGAVIGGFMLCLIAPKTIVPEIYGNPNAVLVFYGFLIGVAAWLGHRFLIRRIETWLREKFPTVNDWFEETSDSKPPLKNNTLENQNPEI
jgi:hypothetical protein